MRAWLLGLLAGGAALGVVVGLTTGAGSSDTVLASAPTYTCPGGAPEGELHSEDRVLVTARDDTGDWLQVRSPRNRGLRVWIEAPFVTVDRPTDELDVESCEPSGDVVLTPVDETPTTTVPGAEEPDDSAGGGGPAAPRDTTGPTITSASVTPTEIWETDPTTGCDEQATVAASATDPSGIASIKASWAFPTVNETKDVTATFGPFPYLTVPVNTSLNITITITARDRAGNVSTTTRPAVLHSAALCLI